MPDVIHDQSLFALAPGEHAQAAGQMMVERDISAVLVTASDGLLLGIVT